MSEPYELTFLHGKQIQVRWDAAENSDESKVKVMIR